LILFDFDCVAGIILLYLGGVLLHPNSNLVVLPGFLPAFLPACQAMNQATSLRFRHTCLSAFPVLTWVINRPVKFLLINSPCFSFFSHIFSHLILFLEPNILLLFPCLHNDHYAKDFCLLCGSTPPAIVFSMVHSFSLCNTWGLCSALANVLHVQ